MATARRLYFENLFSEQKKEFSKIEKAPLSNFSQNLQKVLTAPKDSEPEAAPAHLVRILDRIIIPIGCNATGSFKKALGGSLHESRHLFCAPDQMVDISSVVEDRSQATSTSPKNSGIN